MNILEEFLSTNSLEVDNEKQFQFELAWYLKERCSELGIALEGKVIDNHKKTYIDLTLYSGDKIIPIELKYKTRTQGAADEGSYDFFKDIDRIEKFVKKGKISLKHSGKEFFERKCEEGFAIMVTNYRSYYDGPKKSECYWDAFSLKDGRKIEKQKYLWKKMKSDKTENRE